MLSMIVSFYRGCERDLRGRSRNAAICVLRFALKYTNAGSKDARVRCSSFASDILQAFQGVPIEDGLAEYVADMFMSLLQDKTQEVRLVAAKTLGMISATTAIVDELGSAIFDQAAAVRVAVLKSLGSLGSWKDYAADVAQCVRDPDVDVRVEAYRVLAKGEPKWFLTEQLREILLSGFSDNEEKVQIACSVFLLKRLLPFFENDPENLLQELTSDEYEQDIIMKAFVRGGLKLSVEYFRSRIDDMSAEAARLWQTFVEDLPAESKEDVLPSLEAFCAVLTHYSGKKEQFICLSSMIRFYDLSLYEPARELLSETLREVLRDENNEDEAIKGAAQDALKIVHPDPLDWAQVCLEIVSDLIDEKDWINAIILADGLLQEPKLGLSVPGVRELKNTVLLPSVQCTDPRVRAAAIRVLGAYSILSIDEAVSYMLLFTKILNYDVEICQAEATKVIFDFCVVYGAALVERLDEPVLQELKNGTQYLGEQNAVLARILAPLDQPDSLHSIHEICCIGLAKLLLHQRLISPPLLGRAVCTAASGVSVMQSFVDQYAHSLPTVSLPRLRKALEYAATMLRGEKQGSNLKGMAAKWNVPWDTVAAFGLRGGGDVLALQRLSSSGSAASKDLKEAMVETVKVEKRPRMLDALYEWAGQRSVTLPLAGGRKKLPVVKKKAKSTSSPSASASKKAKKSPVKAAVVSEEAQKWKAQNDFIDDFQLVEEEATPLKMTPARRWEPPNRNVTVVQNRKRERNSGGGDVPVIDLTLDKKVRQQLEDAKKLEEENRMLREQLLKLKSKNDSVVMASPTKDFSPARKRGRAEDARAAGDVEETPVHEDKKKDKMIEIEILHKTSSDVEQTPLHQVSKKMVLCTGFTAEEKQELNSIVEMLGGSAYTASGFSKQVSHVVCKDGERSSRAVAAGLRGIWIVSKDWLLDSKDARQWQDEPKYGWKSEPKKSLVFMRKVFVTDEFKESCKAKKEEMSLSSIEGLLFSLGLAIKVDSASKADIIIAPEKHKKKYAPKSKFNTTKVYSWSHMIDEILTKPKPKHEDNKKRIKL